MPDKTPNSRKGLFESLAAIATTLVAVAHTRLEMLSIDLEEDRERLMSLVTLSLVALFSLMVSVVLVTITLVVAFWDSYRILALTSLAGFFLLLGLVTWRLAVLKAETKPRLFLASLLELLKDHRQLDSH